MHSVKILEIEGGRFLVNHCLLGIDICILLVLPWTVSMGSGTTRYDT